uniref:Uncharacterized protein n=1 Tax=Craspedostauros australis TaxID=1486917 RepID=A0A7R9WQY8_9STRA
MTTVKAFALNQVFDAAEQVSGVLEDMVHDYKTLNSTCRPTVSILQEALFIISCNRNSQISMLEKADRIVEIAQELKITTHRKFWNTYIAVCGRELEHKEEAWKAAQLAFDNLHSSEFSVDANTYVLMLRACSNLMESSSSLVLTPEDEAREARRKGIILELVKRCKKDGMFKSKVERVVETLGVQIPAAVPVEIQERAPLPAQMQETVDDEEQDFGERENDDHGEDRLEPAIKVDLPPMPKP